MVRNRFPRLVGLGPKLPLLGARQRGYGHGTSDEIVISRPGVVNRRLSWPGGQRACVRDHRTAVDFVRSGVSAGEVPNSLIERSSDQQQLKSDIQVLHVQRVVFDELAARFDILAHKRGKIASQAAISSSFTESSVRRSGSMVVSQ